MEVLNTYLFHWLPSKAIWIGGHTLSWDARCSGIYIGFETGVLYHFVPDKMAKNLPQRLILLASTLLFLPLFLDVFAIKYGFKEASNDMRYLTGLLFGVAFSIYLYPTFITVSSNKGHNRATINSLFRFVVLLTIIIGNFFMKSWNNIVAYAILETLSILGFVSLFSILFYGTFTVLKNILFFNKRNWKC